MSGAAAVDAAADLLYELEPLDWLVLGAAAVALVVLLLELRRSRRAPLTPAED